MTPSPGVSEPHMWYNVEWGWLWTAIPSSDSEKQLFGIIVLLCSLDKNVPVSIILEDSGIKYLVFSILLSASRIFLDKILVWELSLRVFVEKFHVRMLEQASNKRLKGRSFARTNRWTIVKMKMGLLDTLAMVALWIGQSE